jgi:hypothetical protein
MRERNRVPGRVARQTLRQRKSGAFGLAPARARLALPSRNAGPDACPATRREKKPRRKIAGASRPRLAIFPKLWKTLRQGRACRSAQADDRHGENMKNPLFPLFALLLGAGVSFGAAAQTNGVVKPNPDDPRECARNFTYDGSFAKGRTFKTNALVRNVSQDQAMKRAVRYIANDGWQINNTNTELGIISASQTVSYGNGKTAPLNVGIESAQGGVEVSLTYAISGGLSSPVDAVQNFFCTLVSTIEGK